MLGFILIKPYLFIRYKHNFKVWHDILGYSLSFNKLVNLAMRQLDHKDKPEDSLRLPSDMTDLLRFSLLGVGFCKHSAAYYLVSNKFHNEDQS